MLLLFVALLEEAKPLIKKYHLKKNGSIYCNEIIKLIITGTGPFNSCKMVERFGTKEDIFINIGCCWSKKEEVGSLFVIGKLQMENTTDFPKFSFPMKEKIYSLTTTLSSTPSYETNNLVDMEGFGFFKSALSFANREEILLIKIVSDNENFPFEKDSINQLIEKKIDTIDFLIRKMQKKAKKDFTIFFENWHFTETEKNILKDLLHSKDIKNSYQKVKTFTSAKKIISYFDKKELLIL